MPRPGTIIDRTIGLRVRALRRASGMLLSEVAVRLHVPIAHLEAVEAGAVRASPDLLDALSLLLRVKIVSFFEDVADGRVEAPAIASNDR
jgi:transcriptional regulator with XRE-family HTH domain